MHHAHTKASQKAYRCRYPSFYDALTTTEDWPAEMSKYVMNVDRKAAGLNREDDEDSNAGDKRPISRILDT